LTVSASGSVRADGGGGWPARALARLTPREAWLLAGLGLTALAVCAFYALQWNAGERDRAAAAQADLALARQAHAIAAQRFAGGRVADADAAAAGAWTLHARNLWLARLKIEQALNAAAVAARLPSPQIKVAEALEDGSAAPLLKAEVSGPYVSGAWIGFLRALAASGPTFVVDKLDVGDAESAQYTLTLLAPVTLDEAPPAAGPADAAAAP
jgi:hypothetical protein